VTKIPVIYVVGSSHSGSTLIAFLADQHPEIASVGETAVKRRIRWEGRAAAQLCSCGASIETCPFWTTLFCRLSADGIPFSADRWRTDYRFEHPWLDRVFTRETSVSTIRHARHWAMRRLPGLRERSRRVDRTNVAFMREVLARGDATVFLDTSKLLTRAGYLCDIPEIDLRLVRLARDARGFAASAKRRGESVATAARVWRHDQIAIDRFLADRPHLSHLLVRYEDLCSDSAATLSRLWAFCGVAPNTPSAVIHTRDHHILGNSMRMGDTIQVRLDESWRSRLGREDEKRVLDIAGDLNTRLGYLTA
jgi:hypothetical protein